MNLSNSKEETFSFGYETNEAVRCYENSIVEKLTN